MSPGFRWLPGSGVCRHKRKTRPHFFFAESFRLHEESAQYRIREDRMNFGVKGRMGSWILLLVAIALSGCTAAKLQPEQISSIRNIGVLSLLPTELHYTKIGVTVFNNEHKSIPVGDVLNDAARFSAQRWLQRVPGRKVSLLRDETDALRSRYYGRSMVMSDSTERIQNELIQMTKANGLDAIIVIGEVFDRDQGRAGVRVFLRAGLGDIRAALIQPDVVLQVVDKSGTAIARDYVQPDGSPAVRSGDRAWEYRLDANLDEATQAKLLTDMEHAISESVGMKIGRLGF